MNIHIEKAGGGLSVLIDDIAGREHAVLQRIRSCRASAWACPSGECLKIATMDERSAQGRVHLTLTARPGEELSAAGIEECLRYMLR